MSDQQEERRREERLPAALPIKVQILHASDTIARKSFRGEVSNFNEHGARLTIFDLSVGSFLRIVQDIDRRYVRLTCVLPPDDKEVRLYGRMHYFHFHTDHHGGDFCVAGVNFTEQGNEELKRIRDFANWLDSQPRP